ncbi:MAG: hypothetical protein LBT44_04410 [Clostridiales bacterium]|jgi:DNA-directed RNA polymerase subunit RPC12/RpoP|nr:hypothetical protein [Clostridiales bacterium]
MKCPYCDSQFDVKAMQEYSEELKRASEDHFGWETYDKTTGSGDWKPGELEAMVTYGCPSCGGEIVCDQNTIATSCPYCGNHAIMTKQTAGMLKPDYVIPFQLDKNAAQNALRNFYQGKPFLPKSFSADNQIENISGVYVPFWLFDCDAHASMRYKATRSQHWSDARYDYTKTDFYQIFREGGIGFDKIPVEGSKKMDGVYMEAIEPFDYTKLTAFNTAFLSGFLADKYDVDAKQSQPRANERIQRSVEQAFDATVRGYATCALENAAVRFSHGAVRYALLPVWMLNTRYRDKMYTFAMNGQTGKFIGSLPTAWGKFWAWFLGLFICLSLIGGVWIYLA